MNLMYCADKNKQQLGLQEFLFGISMTQKTKDRQPKILYIVYRLLDIKQSTTTPYHAMGNGLVENFNKK